MRAISRRKHMICAQALPSEEITDIHCAWVERMVLGQFVYLCYGRAGGNWRHPFLRPTCQGYRAHSLGPEPQGSLRELGFPHHHE